MRGKKLLVFTLAASLATCLSAGVCLLSGCSDRYEEDLALHLTFDEGKGKTVYDASGNVRKGQIAYVYNDAKFMPSRDPEWRENGVKGGSLLFDGYSNFISYSDEEICVSGNTLTVSAYIAPRMFEYDAPNAKDMGNESLTGIVSQYYRSSSSNDGFILGYWRFGELSFQVGTGNEWLRVWSGESRLNKYEWNHVVGVFDGENGYMALYLNGEEVAREEIEAGSRISKPTDTYLYVGSNGSKQINKVSGLLDEVSIYGAVLRADYIKEQYEETECPEIPFEDIWMQKDILKEDIYKTQYHGGPYQMWMNEPHAPVYYNGVYHIFHQFNMAGPYFRQLCWGHFTSTDMVNWTPRKEVITPMADSVCPDGVWSGGAIKDVNGVPVLFFTAGNDAKTGDGLISNQNIGYAYPKDLTDPYLTEWVVGEDLAIKQEEGQGQAGEFRDAHVWVEDGVWYMTICSSNRNQGCVLLYQSDMLEVDFESGDVDMNWTYRGILHQLESADWSESMGKTWELPVMLPIYNADKTVKKHVLIMSPAPASTADNNIFYFLGTFDKKAGEFIPDPEYAHAPKRLDYGPNVFTGPSAMIDDVSGEVHLFSIAQDYRSNADVFSAGWACSMGIVRKIWLNDDGSRLKIDAVSAVKEDYTTELTSGTSLTVEEANAKLADCKGDMLLLSVTFAGITSETETVSVRVKAGNNGSDYTDFTFNAATGMLSGFTNNRGDQGRAESDAMKEGLTLKDGKLTVEIYIDRSLVEAFFNTDIAISMRSYAKFASTDIILSAEGGNVTVENLKLCSVRSIY